MRALSFSVRFALLAALLLPAQASAQKIFINPSNQIHNAVAGGGVESTYAMINGNIAKDILVANGFTVTVDDDFDNAPSRANSWGAAAFVSFHSNAGGGHGTETLYGVSSGSQTLSSKVQAGLIAKLPYGNRGVKDGTWAFVLRTTNMQACLLEAVFHDCASSSGYPGHPPAESAYLKSSAGQQAIGAGAANGVCQRFKSADCSSGGVTPTKGHIKGVVHKSGDLSQRISPATVSLNTGASTTYSGAGTWTPFEVDAGTYTITASAAGYRTATRSCTVSAGADAWCSIGLEADTVATTGRVMGVVYKNGSTSDTVAPATVQLSTGASTTYDGTALWSFDVPLNAAYSATASAAGYQTNSRACSPASGSIFWCSIELTATPPPQKGTLKGVVYQDGDPGNHVAPATVTLSTGQTASFDGVSDWSFELDPGSYSVSASAAGYLPNTRQCDPVVGGAPTRCDIELTREPPPDPVDAGTTEPDAGIEEPVDAGQTEPEDAGTVEPTDDAGTVEPVADAGGEQPDAGPRVMPEVDDGACGCGAASNGALGLMAIPFVLAASLRPRRRRD